MIDTHVHVACPNRSAYPRAGSGVGSDWHELGGDPAEVLSEVWAGGVDAAVVVQAVGVYRDDWRCAADTVAADPARLAFVPAVVLPGRGAAGRIRAMSSAPVRPVGLRLFAIGADVEAFDSAEADGWIDACVSVGAVPVVTAFPHHLAGLARLARRHREVTMVLDHAGFPERGPGLDHVLDSDNVVLKITTHVLDHQPDPAGWLARLRDHVGTGRLCWGSDHPQHPGSYRAKLATLDRAIARWSTIDRAEFTDHTARTTFGLADAFGEGQNAT